MDAAEDTRSTTSSATVAKEDGPTNPGEIDAGEGLPTDPVDSLGQQEAENKESDALEEGEILVRGFQMFVVSNVDVGHWN
jgi:hypothetical protein